MELKTAHFLLLSIGFTDAALGGRKFYVEKAAVKKGAELKLGGRL